MKNVIKSELTREAITDIWFVSEIELQEIACKLGISSIHYDRGDSWEWVSGKLFDFQLDMTRIKTVGVKDIQIRMFLFDEDLYFSEGFTDYLAEKLKSIGISPIYFGRWVPIEGDRYKQVIIKKEA